MYHKDFIMKMIEMIAEVVARILGLINKGDPEQAARLLENSFQEFLKKDASFFRKLPKEKLTNDLLEIHNYTNDHLSILAELFIADAELEFARSNFKVSLENFEKAQFILNFIDKESNNFSLDRKSKIEKIEKRILDVTQTKRA